jgi:hypothetical protein
MKRIVRALSALILAASFVAVAGEIGQQGRVFKQPQLASRGSRIGIVFGAENTIYFAASGDEGRTFSTPVLVAAAPGLSLGNHRGPRIAFTADAVVITAGVGPAKAQYGPNTLRSWRSIDEGKTWSAGEAISALESAGMGFHALASDGKQGLWSLWLGPVEGHVKLFGAHSADAGVTWSKPRIIYDTAGGVCECCHPSAAITADGSVLVMFRNSLEGARDLYLSRSTDGGETFTMAKLGEGTWPIDACPMDGGGFAEFRGDVVTVWRRQSELFLAKPDGKPEQRLGAGKNPAIGMSEKGVSVVWQSGEGLMAKVPGRVEPYVLAKTGSFPSIAGRAVAVAAWEDDGVIRTKRLE